MNLTKVKISGDWIVWSTEDRIHFESNWADAMFDQTSGFFYTHLQPQGLVKLVPFHTKSKVLLTDFSNANY